jgi:hypothetical protein
MNELRIVFNINLSRVKFVMIFLIYWFIIIKHDCWLCLTKFIMLQFTKVGLMGEKLLGEEELR